MILFAAHEIDGISLLELTMDELNKLLPYKLGIVPSHSVGKFANWCLCGMWFNWVLLHHLEDGSTAGFLA